MILKQYRRFLKRSPLVTLLAGAVLAVGFAGAALTSTVMLAMLAPKSGGLRAMHYVTVAEETSGGGSRPIAWKSYERLQQSSAGSDTTLVAYSEPILAHLSYQQNERDVLVAAVSNGFFSTFTQGLDRGHDFSSSWQGGYGGTEVILSSDLAQRLFTDPGEALGRSITLNNQTFQVAGIATKSFSGLWSSTDVWVTPDKIASLAFGARKGQPQAAGSEHSADVDSPETWQKVPFFMFWPVRRGSLWRACSG